MNRYRAHPPPTTREQYTMAKQPQATATNAIHKIRAPVHRREKTTDDYRNKQADQNRQTRTLTRAADGKNPKGASSDNLTDAPLPATRVERRSDGHRRDASEQRNQPPHPHGHPHGISTTSSRPPQSQTEPTPIAKPSRPTSRETRREDR